jgi:Rad3-related DNA helicase
VVGVGLPQISFERNLIRDYFASSDKGYEYAYMDPGINKVMQALGRLIRSETDKGAALLIDDRYMRNDYRELFQRLYPEYEVLLTEKETSPSLNLFYKKAGL